MQMINRFFRIALVLTTIAIVHCELDAQFFQLPRLVSDNMVLQRGKEATLCGRAVPGAAITVQASWGKNAGTTVSPNGTWRVSLATPSKPGPFEIVIKAPDTTVTLKNVLVGEVWLCSGQSNMEMPLEGWPPTDTIANWQAEIASADQPLIRLFTVPRTFSAVPESTYVGEWLPCTPAHARTFSATAYFFGRRLAQNLKVPIGLIHSSWGGTPIEAWMSAEVLAGIPEFDGVLKKMAMSKDGVARQAAWLNAHPRIDMSTRKGGKRWEGLSFDDEPLAARTFGDTGWQAMSLPITWERTEVGNFDGVLWFRKQIELPKELRGQTLTLKLGPIDDMDETFVNGVRIGAFLGDGYWKVNRVYTIPDSIAKDSILQIAVRVIDTQGGGGIWGNGENLEIVGADSSKRLSLNGRWKYLPVAEYRGSILYVFGGVKNDYAGRTKIPVDISPYAPTTLYNAMIHPLIPFRFRGAIWYQGESNAGNPPLYAKLFPMMIANWRKDFDNPSMPFYFVQIAPYVYDAGTHSERLREAQMKTLSVPGTGMAVTLDIGNPTNIHPANKQDVGGRLGALALAKTYGKKILCMGPVVKSVKPGKGKITITFDNAEKGLAVKPLSAGNGFQIAGEDRQFKDAVVTVKGTTLIISHPDIAKPVAVRYAFTNISEGTLFNGAGLPASSFRTDTWE